MIKIFAIGDNSINWAKEMKKQIEYYTDNPISFIRASPLLKEEEWLQWFIDTVKRCNVVIVNLDDINADTYKEIIVANTVNIVNNTHAFIIGFGSKQNLPKIIKKYIYHTDKTVEETAEYIASVFID